ncbi:MAG: tRNA preQ1(34) S-adenosylmethionine ribosyltransferase-isomerase QueA [Thiotrichales bacterium]|jgi:S-adenosylmethionine:tRNA ribosyltransferase-isomerase|nr:tRNA preQ1(34) S-adenosylmethionine ribosyltransferase-isomerase QueA [Thiotrichales bacterium]MBT3613501.1 tRNA preQ1(34) S-adenosylmethionine ribosyltransferase-isomerase QueA [Thiotrichales bacterium]MBT3753030.1 tRNA preQ1(34) S-adenosylmethionine ribosyltransferase-isomerase QueA [Thiotrichales bacterium]MBT3837832.1 tRNA preQ1(34) S-adenosylmethionine ribosyltransferase-isomerase QueA [Thiotrichales bacterium]MBT4151663.1 tRNA preQ1(34) S-adenosylmethionine ribosyltransferase-isomerase
MCKYRSKKSDFHFDIPKQLIAQTPPVQRGKSRMLILDGEKVVDSNFSSILKLLNSNDLLVFNDTKVIPARLFGKKESGGKVELLIERILDESRILTHIRASKSPKSGTKLWLEDSLSATVVGRSGEFFEVEFEFTTSTNSNNPYTSVVDLLEDVGRLPLPPYIEREPDENDRKRYQTVYARHKGAVAAPTAGLHFTDELLKQIKERGVAAGFVTLHVGAGTFQPVRTENIEDHIMHSEWLEVSDKLCEQVRATQQRGGRVVAVGTTAVRSLESASNSGTLKPMRGDTDIFITPGYKFKTVDALLTNFHLPESTLMMLVTAFGGYNEVMNAYRHAVREKYHFFSYGDAMFISSLRETNIEKSAVDKPTLGDKQ